MFTECTIRNLKLAPARFSAPLAGFTHSPFRRLLADFGHCGAVWTEMLAGPQLLRENFDRSPWLRRRPDEPPVVYQLMVRDTDPIDRILDRMAENGVAAIDVNLACNAFSIRCCEAGSALFEDFKALTTVTESLRRHWPGLLLAKIRLGSQKPGWESRLKERLMLLSDTGFDAITVHPRFFEERFRRRARLELLPWLRTLTPLPLIANGDLRTPSQTARQSAHLEPACAIMVGRMAIAQPWIFSTWNQVRSIDPAAVWFKFASYATDDFSPTLALSRLKMFTKYFSINFSLGHFFRFDIQNAPTWEDALDRAKRFFDKQPTAIPDPIVGGL